MAGSFGSREQPWIGKLDFNTLTWSPLSTRRMPRQPRAGVWAGDRLYLSAWGQNGDEAAVYDPKSDTWSAISSEGTPKNGYPVWTGDTLFMWGGFESQHTAVVYDPANDRWRPASNIENPVGAPQREVVLGVGGRLMVWRGDLSNARSNRVWSKD